MINSCYICEHTDFSELSFKEMMFGFGDQFEYVRCKNCGCVQIKEIPENIGKYYPDDYYSFQEKNDGFFVNFIKNMRNSWAVFGKNIFGYSVYKIFSNPTLFSLQKLNLKKNYSILDVGCGSGDVLLSLSRLGFSSLYGIDPYIKKEVYRKGLEIRKQTIFEINKEKKFDVIMMHHSLEHMDQQGSIFKVLKEILSPNGVVVIRIPLSDSWVAKEYGKNWVQADAPRHLFLHTRKSMSIIAENSGFFVDSVVYDSTEFQFVGSIGYQKSIPLVKQKSVSFLTKAEIYRYKKKAKELNKKEIGDQACFYLKHKNE